LKDKIRIIEKKKIPAGWDFLIEVSDGVETSHEVILTTNIWEKLKGNRNNPEDLIIDSFKFLLERESSQSILKKFDLELIGKYFPEFEEDILK